MGDLEGGKLLKLLMRSRIWETVHISLYIYIRGQREGADDLGGAIKAGRSRV